MNKDLLSLLNETNEDSDEVKAYLESIVESILYEGKFGKMTKTLSRQGKGAQRYSDIAKSQTSKSTRNKRTTALSVRGRHQDDRQ